MNFLQKKSALALALLLTALTSAFAQNFPNGFNFNLPEFDGTAQAFLPTFPAYTIGESQRVTAQGEQFVAAGQPLRFWGVNIVASGAFPPKDKAPGIAARLRKMGVNLVRFHHLENNWSGTDGCIFVYAQGSRKLNPATLDRLDFFINELKKNGVYVNMNLNVSRVFQASDGVPGADSLVDFAKGATLFDGYLQHLQKEYAEQLLGHTNPYTGLPLAKDPVLAMVEMNNENTLYGYWKDGALRPFADGGSLLHRHSTYLDAAWNLFLQKKYNSPAALAAAWNVGTVPPGAGELLQNRGFEVGNVNAPWSLELHETAQATFVAVNGGAHTGNFSGRLTVSQVTGTDWHIQLKNTGFSLQKDSIYVLRFWAKADKNTQFSASVVRDNAPYTWYTGSTYSVGTTWKEYTLSFIAPETNSGFGRISLSPLQNTGTFWFDDFSLAPPSVSGVLPGEELSKNKVRRILWSERLLYSLPRITDMGEFYIETQKSHFDDLRAHLRANVGVLAPITGTNALVGPADAAHQEDFDYLDDHSYWDHPGFPSGAWDGWNWLIGNQPQVTANPPQPCTTSAFSGLNFLGKPFTLSEYNYSAPNRWRAEMPATIAAYASFHGADGIMFFDYNSDLTWEEDVTDGFFSLNRDNSVMALFPSCAWAYRRGLIAPDPAPLTVQYSRAGIGQLSKQDNDGRWGRFTPYDKSLLLSRSVRTTSYRAAQNSDFATLPAAGQNPYTTSTNETRLDMGKGVLTTATPGFCSVTGFLKNAPNTPAGDLTLVQGSDFGSVTWVSLSSAPLKTAQRSLLTVASKQQNTGMIWEGTTTVHDDWGSAPTLQLPLALTMRLSIAATSIRLYSLDSQGKESTFKTYQPNPAGFFDITIDQNQTKTLWYGIEASGPNVVAAVEPKVEVKFQISPNPVRDVLRVWWSQPLPAGAALTLTDAQGRTLRSVVLTSENVVEVPMGDLPAGMYFVVVQAGGAVWKETVSKW